MTAAKFRDNAKLNKKIPMYEIKLRAELVVKGHISQSNSTGSLYIQLIAWHGIKDVGTH